MKGVKRGNAATCQLLPGIARARRKCVNNLSKGIAKDERCALEIVSARDVNVGKLELNALKNATFSKPVVRMDFNSKLPSCQHFFEKVKRMERYFISL